jgi:dolichol-phosphate mannosyltransferase
MDRILVFLPTLNESESASTLIAEIDKAVSVDFLVIDDGSTDGTYNELIQLNLQNLEVKQRGTRLGIGSAHSEALRYAKNNSYDYILTMDADGTHRVVDVIRILQRREDADLIVGSRFAPGAGISDWPYIRVFLTHTAHLVTKFGLGLKYDCSSGLRCYKLASFETRLIEKFDAIGYDFFFKSMHQIASEKRLILDFPVSLEARVLGSSKMTVSQACRSITVLIFKVVELRWKQLLTRF